MARGEPRAGMRKPQNRGSQLREQTTLRERVAKAMNVPVSSISSVGYVGRDKAGQPMYRIRYKTGPMSRYDQSPGRSTNRAPWVSKTVVLNGNKISAPLNRESALGPGPTSAGPTPDEISLDKAKDRALSWLNTLPDSQISMNDRTSFANQIQNWKGSSSRLSLWVERVLKSNLPFTNVVEEQGMIDDGGYWDGFDFGDGGGGGGFTGPEYRAPDRRVIEDMTKGLMTSLVGGPLEDARVEAAVNLYMTDHRRNFDSVGNEISPEQSLLEYIREQPEYQEIHELRPEGEDERSWVAQRRAAGERGGLSTGELDDFAVDQAIVGGDLEDVQQAGAVRQLQTTGRAPQFLDQQFRQVARGMLAGVR